MNIYIYGTKKFKNNIRSILLKANLGINIEILNTLFAITTKLKTSPQDIFIIDEAKVRTPNFFTKRLKFLFSSDKIEKELIEKYGAGDVCFNSMDGMIGYINSRIRLEEKALEPELRDVALLKNIDEIQEDEIENEMFGHLKT